MRRRNAMVLAAATVAGAGLVGMRNGGRAVAQTVPPSSPVTTVPSSSVPTSDATTSTGAPSPASSAQPFTAAQLDQMMAPIALYPDPLLAQMLMAATYPLEVVEAARWSKDNPSLKGDAALAAVKDKGWDVSVTSLVAFPQVLAMMNSKLDWTQKIGDAMIAQQSDVAASIQRLRAQSQAAGMLKSTPQQTVTSQPAGAGAPAGTPAAIVIQPTNPDVVYVPTYDTNVVYGTWPYASNPPYYYPPPSYGWGWGDALVGGFAFGVGFAIGGAFFGGWSWGGGWGGGWGWRGWGGWGHGNSYTTVNINRATYITNNFNRNHYDHGRWNHDPAHRHGVPYRDRNSRERYDQHHPDAAQRQAFRGRIDREPRANESRDAGRRGDENRDTAGRGNDDRRGDDRGGDARRDEGRGRYNGGEENRGRENSHAMSSVNHGRWVNHEASRGRTYRGHPHFSHASHAGYHGGGHRGGGGHGGRR
ncbi:MAG: DUF3300 domain-containing protein [Rhodospirillales bacterium]|nr:DUF3300 domain-containing protein [Rhodospirillales bacterium]